MLHHISSYFVSFLLLSYLLNFQFYSTLLLLLLKFSLLWSLISIQNMGIKVDSELINYYPLHGLIKGTFVHSCRSITNENFEVRRKLILLLVSLLCTQVFGLTLGVFDDVAVVHVSYRCAIIVLNVLILERGLTL